MTVPSAAAHSFQNPCITAFVLPCSILPSQRLCHPVWGMHAFMPCEGMYRSLHVSSRATTEPQEGPVSALCYMQAKPGVKLHVLGETVDGHDLDVLQVRRGGPVYHTTASSCHHLCCISSMPPLNHTSSWTSACITTGSDW